MRIGLTYDLQTDPADERQAEFDSPRTIEALEGALVTLGHQAIRLGSAEQLLAAPERVRAVDLIFNLAEGSQGRCREAWVPMLLECWGVPFVGSGALAQMLGLDKVMSKRLASVSGVATPQWVVAEPTGMIPSTDHLAFPLIVKPRDEGSGIGIDPGAVVHDHEALIRRVQWLIRRLSQPVLVEEFVTFGELTVFLIGDHPPTALPAIQRSLDPQSRLSCHVVRAPACSAWLCPVELTPELDATARRAAVTVFETLGCADMARVDFRLSESGQLFFLEINPLPSFDPEGTLGLLAESLGTTYTQLVGRILDAACERRGVSVHERV